ncbi:MAG TPA: hypothetical protein VD813_03730 [Pseudonocardia sp.]|nr:hypothetical protein [Pseudonocardia sp.]
MARVAGVIVGLEIAALVLAYLSFGWPALLVGGPLLLGTLLVLAAVIASEGPRRRLARQRAARFDPNAQLPGGLMSGFFEVPEPRR